MDILDSHTDLNRIKQRGGFSIKSFAGGNLSMAQHQLSSRVKKLLPGNDSVGLYLNAGIKIPKGYEGEAKLRVARDEFLERFMFRCTSRENIELANQMVDDLEVEQLVLEIGKGVKRIFDNKTK